MIRVSTLSKELGTSNEVLVGFLAKKYPEFGITDYKTHHGKTISALYEKEVREEFAKYLKENPESRRQPATESKDVPVEFSTGFSNKKKLLPKLLCQQH